MKFIFALGFLFLVFNYSHEEILLNTPTHACIRCICHAVSGCFRLQNCAKYSMNMEYWETAGSPEVSTNGNKETRYKACMLNDNCILETINKYTSRMGDVDCNCDGEFNCEDQFAIHYNHCENMTGINNVIGRAKRFQACSGQIMDVHNQCVEAQ